MTIQTKLRTNEIIPNSNMCFPIDTILAVKKQYEKLGFSGQKLENFEADERAVSSIKSDICQTWVGLQWVYTCAIFKIEWGGISQSFHPFSQVDFWNLVYLLKLYFGQVVWEFPDNEKTTSDFFAIS